MLFLVFRIFGILQLLASVCSEICTVILFACWNDRSHLAIYHCDGCVQSCSIPLLLLYRAFSFTPAASTYRPHCCLLIHITTYIITLTLTLTLLLTLNFTLTANLSLTLSYLTNNHRHAQRDVSACWIMSQWVAYCNQLCTLRVQSSSAHSHFHLSYLDIQSLCALQYAIIMCFTVICIW